MTTLHRAPIQALLAIAWLHASISAAQPAPSRSHSHAAEQHAVAEALARYRGEPSVRELVAAMRAREGSSASELGDRARLSGWVPTVGLKARRGQAVDLASSSDDDALKLSTDDDLTLEAALTFDLGRVVFAREEVAIARQVHAEREHVQERVREVIALYFERRRLQVERDLLRDRAAADRASQRDGTPNEDGDEPGPEAGARPGGTPPATRAPRDATAEAIATRDVRIAEIEALLDTFTGGAFRRMMARPREPHTP